jgi:hypothetical protein
MSSGSRSFSFEDTFNLYMADCSGIHSLFVILSQYSDLIIAFSIWSLMYEHS